MATIVYLDAEDEITSAASRIREAADTRVGLVLPFGSRVATSRINFRLLAREAMSKDRRLDIIAPDASARALAASAGLPVFGSVAEYESALEAPPPGMDAEATAGGAFGAGAAAGGADVASVAGPSVAAGTVSSWDRTEPAVVGDDARAGFARPAPLDAEDRGRRDLPVMRSRRRLPVRAVAVAVVLLLVIGGAGAVAGYLLLPSAVITITPRIEEVGPISFDVHANPAATAVDAAAGVIPAQTLTIPVESQGDFPATGKRVEKTAATGGVRFKNCDTSNGHRILAGTVVKTPGGVSFTTDQEVFLPVAPILQPGDKLDCQTSETSVTAVKQGTDGNVKAGTITVLPASLNANVLSVTNLDPTSGGSRTEYVRVSQADVDAAVEQLTKDIEAQFATELENPTRVPPGTTAFPDTAVLGDTVPSVDPATLVGQEVDSFTLRMTAQGTVLAVDPAPVQSIARQRLSGDVSDGYRLVDGSTSVEVGDGEVVAGVVTFPVTGSAREVQPVDGPALQTQVLGMSESDARALLAPYGDVTIELWPDWVHSVPSLQQRVTLTVNEPVDTTPSPSASPVPSVATQSEAPSGSPSEAPSGGAGGSEPVPSAG